MRRRGFIAGVLAGLAAGRAGADVARVRPAPRPAGQAVPAAVAAARLGAGTVVAFALRDGATGALLAGQGEQVSLPPASTLKTVTTLYALDRLGPQHRFVTRILLDGDRLVLAGGGDPTLDSDGLARLAADAAARLRGRVPARLAVWGGALPQAPRLAEGQAAHVAYDPALSGIILNFNRVHLGWQAGGRGLTLEAQAEAHSPPVSVIAARAADRALPIFDWQDGPEREAWSVARGAMGRAGSRWLPVRRPEAYAGDVLRSLMRAEGVALPAADVLDHPPGGEEIARLDSAPLAGVLRDMLDYSTNVTAEAVGLAASGADSIATSGAAMEAWLRAALPAGAAEGLRLADHSGLSAGNRVTAAALTALLAQPAAQARLRPLLKTFETGDRPFAAAQAKTGTLNFVANLAGYAARLDHAGRPLVFAILCVNEGRRAAAAGTELPPGGEAWVARARRMQGQLIEAWARAAG